MTGYRLDVMAVYQADPLRVGYFEAEDHDQALTVAQVVMAVLATDAELHAGGLWAHLELASSQADSWGATGRCAGCHIEQREAAGEEWVDLSALLLVDQEGAGMRSTALQASADPDPANHHPRPGDLYRNLGGEVILVVALPPAGGTVVQAETMAGSRPRRVPLWQFANYTLLDHLSVEQAPWRVRS